MDPITIIITALALGAAAGLEDTVAQAVKDGYSGLKALIRRKYSRVDVELLETAPESKARRAVVEEDLRKTNASEDNELLLQAQKLLEAIQAQTPEVAKVVGVSLQDIKAASVELSSITARGAGSTTGVEMKRSEFAGDVKISQIQASSIATSVTTPELSASGVSDSERKVTILFLAANPTDTVRLGLDNEIRAIDQALRATKFRDHFDLQQHWAVRVTDLQGALLRHEPAIIHFCGHGAVTGEIVLQDENGEARPVSMQALGRLFALVKDNVRCVVLNACYSEQQARAIAEHITCVVGMSKAIEDRVAITFACAFYQALGYGKDVRAAFEFGRSQVELETLGEEATPRLLSVVGDPGQVFFVAKDGGAFPKT
jgi:hypothetical protein